MPYSPPRWLERLAERLVPPASAEHSLGDLAESSRSDAEYLRHLASILPRVIWSQVRRRATLGGIVFNVILTTIVMMPTLGFPKAPLFSEPWAAVRVAIPIAIWVIGFSLAAAYGPRDKSQSWNGPLFILSIVAAIVGAGGVGLPLERVALGFVILTAIILVLTMPWATNKRPATLSLETLPDHARSFQRTIWWRNTRELVACVAVIVWNARSLWSSENPVAQAGHLLLISGVIFIMGYLLFRAAPRRVPRDADTKALLEFHKSEMVRQRDILLAVTYWYLLPFVPGMLVFAASKSGQTPLPATLVGLIVVSCVFVGIWKLSVLAARWLERELNKVNALEPQR